MSLEIISKGEELFKKKQYHDALTHFKSCVSDADFVIQLKAYYGMACCYTHLQDVYNAKDCFQSVLSISPNSTEAGIARSFIDDAKKWIAGEIDLFSLTSEMKRAQMGSLCANHEKEMAVYMCPSCEKNICLQCTFPVASQYYCFECGRKKEQEDRQSSSLRKKQKAKLSQDSSEAEKIVIHKKPVLHFFIFLILLCFSLLYRFALRDASARKAGLKIVNVHLRMLEVEKLKAMFEKDEGINYALEAQVENNGDNAVTHVKIQIKLYDTFGQKVTERVISLDRQNKRKNSTLKPHSSRAFNVSFKGLKKAASVPKLRITFFQSE